MEIFHTRTAILSAVAFAGAAALVVWRMRRLNLRAQFLVLLAFAVSIGFVFMTVLQVPDFPRWLAASMVLVVFIAAPFATRTFLRSLKEDEQQQAREPNENRS